MRQASLLPLLLLALALIAPPLSASECKSGNLLSTENIVESFGVIREQKLFDGKMPGEGQPIDDFVAAIAIQPNSYLLFDLGKVETINTVHLLSDSLSPQVISTSTDGHTFSPIQLSAPPTRPMIRWRSVSHLQTEARYIRLQRDHYPGGQAFVELFASCENIPQPATLEPSLGYQQTVDQLLDQQQQRLWIKAVLIFVLIPLFWWLFTATARTQQIACLLITLLGALAYSNFTKFHGSDSFIHPWDALHYYLGPKYFDEMKYTELYRCIAAYERQQGRGMMVDRVQVHDLDNYQLHPGSWTTTPEGACRAEFTPERWQAFGEDVDRFRHLFDLRHFQTLLKDHGYNATPVHNSWLSLLTNALPANHATLVLIGSLDLIALALAIAAMWWAFGPLAAALAATIIGFSFPWDFSWNGGSVARQFWFAMLCFALALMKKRHHFTAALLISSAAMLRLFPLVFVGGIVLQGMIESYRQRQLSPDNRQKLLGIITAAVLGVISILLISGADSVTAFINNIITHIKTGNANNLGLTFMLAQLFGKGSLGYTLIWVVGIILSLGLLVVAILRQRPAWEMIPLSGALLFCSLPLMAYDYIWLAVLAPLLIADRIASTALLLFLASTLIITNLSENGIAIYGWESGLLSMVLAITYLRYWQRISSRP